MRHLITLRKISLVIIFMLLAGNINSQTIIDIPVNVAAADSGDDAEERIADGVMDLTSSDLELCTDTDGDQLVGIRFQGVTVPQGATITNAYIQFEADQVTTGAVTVDITGIDVDNAAQFTTTAYNISDRIDGDISDGTTANATWSIADWNTIGETGVDQRTPDISTIVKEIIDRSGWNSGNDMAFVFSPNSGSPNYREPEDGDNGANTLELHIEYTTPTGREINILGNNNTIVNGSTSISTTLDTDYGTVAVGSSVSHTFTIQNFGTTNLTLSGLTRTGDTSDFTITVTPTPGPIGGGNSKTFTIQFAPTVIGTRSATVTINNNDADENPYIFNIQGVGVIPAPEINIIGNGSSIANGDINPETTDDTDFGGFDVATGSKTNTFTIENIGTADLTLDNASPYVVITGDTADFTLTANPSTPIAVSGSTTFDITFDPTQAGIRTAIVSIANNDSDEDPYTFYIQGTGSIIEAGGVWSYLDDGSDQGTAWYGTGFNYTGWATGATEIGYGDGDEVTVLTTPANPKPATVYFRKSFTITAADIASLKNTLVLNAIRDDGMVVYIDGVEVWKDGMPATFDYTTHSTQVIGGTEETTWITTSINNPFTVPGTYEIGVEIHQTSTTSSDLSFNFEMHPTNKLLPSGGLWSYLDDGSDQDTAWQIADVTPTGANWATGNAQLGFGEGDETTIIADNDQITTYFRKTINVIGDDVTNSTLQISAIRDDGMVVYINGVEVLRDNMPVGTINYDTTSFGDVTSLTTDRNFEDFWNVFKVDNPFVTGINEIAVEIHQFTATSDDVSFDFELETSNDIIYVPATKPDRDNDGREDYVDADDDNDGISDIVEGCNTTLPASLETDGDGETELLGSFPITTLLNDGNSVTYSINDPTNFDEINAYDAGEHGYGLRIRGPVTDGQLTLTFTNTVRNLFFKLIDFDSFESFKIDVYDEFGAIVNLNTEEGLYHLGSYIEYLGSNTIREIYNGNAPNINNPENRADDIYGGAYFYFPNVNISKVTFTANWTDNVTIRLAGVQYCSKDTDGDGIDDFYDSDSDNDGIPDLVEVGGTDIDGNGIVDNFIDTDNDGISSIYDTNDNSYFIEELGTLTNLDFDGDGVRNNVDLDSDNDGILDIIEAGGADIDGNGQIDSFTDTNFDGYHDSFDGTGSMLITGADTDNDGQPNSYPNDNPDNTGLPNFLDIDSDDDGITDHTEAQGTAATYITYSGIDTDGDGILDVNDNFVGFAGNGFTPEDSDSDLTPDYLDTNSDNHGELDIIEGHDTNGDGSVNSSDGGTCLSSTTSNMGTLSSIDTDGDGLDDGFDNDLVSYDPSNSGIQPTNHPNIDDISTNERDWREADQEYIVIDFDGVNDYIDFADNHNLTSSFTIEAWVKQDAASTGNGMIISKRDCNKGTNLGYNFGLVNHFPNVKWYDNSGVLVFDLTSAYAIGTDRWYNLSITYDTTTTTAKIYIDGIEVATDSAVASAPSTTNESLLLGAKFDDTDLTQKLSNEFHGWIDEVRIWDTALTPAQIRTMMNQEIQQNGTAVQGKTLLTDIAGLDWVNLLGYYPMNTIVSGHLIDESSGTSNGRIRNILTPQPQTAPLPYTTKANGDWTDVTGTTPWTYGDTVWDYPNSVAIDGTTQIDWNIVVTDHNVEINDDTTVLGLIVNSNDLQVNGDTALNTGNGLTVTHYLKLDGTIDLEGESQLVQTDQSDFDASSSGTLERDQQGYSNTYLYNYWCSPVSTTSNSNYTVPDVISNVGFLTSGFNGSTAPAVADYWLWKYSNRPSNDYSEWQHLRSTGSLLVGEGFTMKGPGTVTPDQNYEFIGQPNNGDFTLPINAGNAYLIGNPYPSALDADKFILDNISSTEPLIGTGYGTGDGTNNKNVINGALYFWDHFAVNSHNLANYQGGYGVYTLMGGTVAISTDTKINATGAVGTKEPERFIAVGQGFFVSSEDIGELTEPIVDGDLIFKNSQRIFQKETVTASNSGSIFFKGSKNAKTNTNDNIDTRQKIRLMFDSPNGYHRQLLIGVDKNTSNGFDLGYDAVLIEDNLEDMYWNLDESKLIIQAVNNFDQEQRIPFSLKIAKEGLAIVRIDDLENIDANKNIYVHDLELNTYHNLRDSEYNITLTPGEYNNRFEITFSENNTSLSIENVEAFDLEIYFSNDKESLIIKNPKSLNIQTVEIHNILSQSVFKLNDKNDDLNDDYLEFKIKKIHTGVYIINLTTDNNKISKKVLVD